MRIKQRRRTAIIVAIFNALCIPLYASAIEYPVCVTPWGQRHFDELEALTFVLAAFYVVGVVLAWTHVPKVASGIQLLGVAASSWCLVRYDQHPQQPVTLDFLRGATPRDMLITAFVVGVIAAVAFLGVISYRAVIGGPSNR